MILSVAIVFDETRLNLIVTSVYGLVIGQRPRRKKGKGHTYLMYASRCHRPAAGAFFPSPPSIFLSFFVSSFCSSPELNSSDEPRFKSAQQLQVSHSPSSIALPKVAVDDAQMEQIND